MTDCLPFVQSRYHQGTWFLKIDVDTAETERASFGRDVSPHPAGNVEFVDISSPTIIRTSTVVICQVKNLLLGRKDTLVGKLASGLTSNGSP